MSTHHHEDSKGHDHHHHHAPPHENHSSTGRGTRRRRRSEHAPPMRMTADPYPFIYSKDMFDRRRYSPFGGGAPTGRVSRGMAIFSVVIIVAVLGIGLATILIGAFGR